ncbi:MAG: RNA polymerase sigma factor [Acidimicrobiia bacterium]
MLRAHDWLDIARNVNWRYRYVAETEVLPEALSQRPTPERAPTEAWPEACQTPFRDYVESPRWTVEPEPTSRRRRPLQPLSQPAPTPAPPVGAVPDDGARAASEEARAPTLFEVWAARFGIDAGDRATANLSALDALGQAEEIVLRDHYRRRERFGAQLAPELDALYRAARSMVSRPDDADDLVQDTLLRAYRSIGSFDGRHPRAWLLTIMRHAAINRARGNSRETLGDVDTFGEIADPGDKGPEVAVVGSVFDSDLEAALRRLPEPQRQVLELVDLRGMSYAEAALALDLRPGTLTSRLSRARAKIQQRLRAGSSPDGEDAADDLPA